MQMMAEGDVADKIDGWNKQDDQGHDIMNARTRADATGRIKYGNGKVEIPLEQEECAAGMEYSPQQHAKEQYTDIDIDSLPAVGIFLLGVCVSGLHRIFGNWAQ
jgi:hypothetical protein